MSGFFKSSWKVLRRLGSSSKESSESSDEGESSNNDSNRDKSERTRQLKVGFLGGDKSKQSANDRRATLLANVSTELRTPLTLILAPLESLLMGNHGALTADQSALLRTIHNNSVRLLQMVSGLLDFSVVQSGSIQVSRQPVDVAVLTGAVVSDFQSIIASRNITLTYDPQQANLFVMIDRYMYERIVSNLISNAVKFTMAGGQVKVSLRHKDDRLELSVLDTGVGIPDETLKSLFQEFKQLNEVSSRHVEGVGLGLSLVKEYADLLNGTVSVRSGTGQGSLFTVDVFAPVTELPAALLPRVESPVMQSVTVAPQPHKTEVGKHLPRVLIAENNAELATYIQGLLNEMCMTKLAADGEEALALANEWHPDLILAAVMLPKRDGLSFCREVKSRPESAVIPVVLLTPLTQREAMLQGWEAGADEYLFKPFHPAELVTRVRSLLRSVQQRKRAQEQIERLNEALEKRVIELANANRELKSLASKLEQARDQALEASRFKSVFLANMSHEIRTPINGVISMSDMLMRTRLTDEQVEVANIIQDSARALLDIINDILDFSKIEAGKLELEIVDFELLHVVEGTAELIAGQARQKKLSLMTYVAPDVPTSLRGDPGRLRQILLNLLSNAIKFTESGEVVVEATLDAMDEKRCRVKFSVRDTGIGMPQEAVYRLFQPFTQADGSITRRYGGTGLGLSIAKLLVELLGGRIGVRSTEGRGSTFWFSVPLERSQAAPEQPIDRGKFDLENTRVLLVETLEGTAKIIQDYTANWGMICETVPGLNDALTSMRAAVESGKPFDLAIVELTMPNSAGLAFAQTVQADPILSKTKLILCTAEDKGRLGEGALQAGFSAYLIKPLKQSRLFDCIALVLSAEDRAEKESLASYMPPRLNTTAEMTVFQKTGMVLVAEDNPVNQKVAMMLLKELGFSAHVVGSGREAVEVVNHTPYSLILMDCQMPDMDGFEATGAIRKAEVLTGRHIPIIAMTAHAMQGDREKCIAAGMDDYVSKPVTAAKLKEVLLRWFKTDSAAWRGVQPAQKNESPASVYVRPPGLLNFESLKETCGIDGAIELIGVFTSSTDTLLTRIYDAVTAKDSSKLKSAAHELKGSCGSMGSSDMAVLCKELEQTAVAQNWDLAPTLYMQLHSIYEQVQSYCKELLDTYTPTR
ncbi:MAG: response regulator [Candidatus Melainabacteria bacterium]|nr:MAG: response regulator [Candidatus Melainabacteria bacterium]